MIDSPTIFRKNDTWYMTYIVFDGQGYETWLAESDDLLHWGPKGKLLSFRRIHGMPARKLDNYHLLTLIGTVIIPSGNIRTNTGCLLWAEGAKIESLLLFT